MIISWSDRRKNSSFAYVINNKRLKLSLAILDINILHVHEETIPELLEKLAQSIKKDGCVKDPIMVDAESLIILDGVHRVAALTKLGYERIPACLVNYKNPAVKVRSWYRTIKGINSQEQIVEQIKQTVNALQPTKKVDENTIGASPIVAAIKTEDKTFLIHASFKNHWEAYNIIKQIELSLKTADFEINYEIELDALNKLQKREVDGVLFTPNLTKAEIVETALSGGLFTYKATRHVFPARPLHVNVPLSLLVDNGRLLNDVNDDLKDMLQKRRLKWLPSGSIFNDRRYEEELYVFEEQR